MTAWSELGWTRGFGSEEEEGMREEAGCRRLVCGLHSESTHGRRRATQNFGQESKSMSGVLRTGGMDFV